MAPTRVTASASSSKVSARKPVCPRLDQLPSRTTAKGDGGRAAGHRLEQHEAEGLGPLQREHQTARAARQAILHRAGGFTHVLDAPTQPRFDQPRVVILLIGRGPGRRDQQARAQPIGNIDRQMRPLVRMKAAEKEQIVRAAVCESGCAKSVTSWPRRTSSSVIKLAISSDPP